MGDFTYLLKWRGWAADANRAAQQIDHELLCDTLPSVLGIHHQHSLTICCNQREDVVNRH